MPINPPHHPRLSVFLCAVFLMPLLLLNPAVADDPAPVSVAMPQQASVADTLRLSGSLSAERSARLSTRVDGLVAQINVDAGSRVEPGDILLALDPAIASLEQAEANAATAEAQAALTETRRLLDEALRLRQQNHISATEVAMRQANLAIATAAYNAARAREKTAAELLQRHQLPAPFAGVISARLTEVGEWVSRGTPVLELVALDQVRLDVMAPQERFADISNKTTVTVISDALPAQRLTGRITALVPVSDSAARAFLVRVVVEDTRVELLPGTSATAVFDLGDQQQSGLLVPRDALLRHPDGGQSLFVVNNGRAERRMVSTGSEGQQGVVILSGINAGEAVVIRGNEVLRDGQAVTVIDGNRS